MKQTHSSVLKMINPDKLIKTFIRFGYKGIVIKQWSSRPIARFVRGGPSARVELLARHISTKSQNWGTTFGMFRCFFGTEENSTDPEYDIPTSDCLATTGPSMFTESKKYIGPRLPTGTVVKDTDGTKRLSFSTSSRVMNIVVCSQNHPANHSSSLTAAT